MCAEHFYIYIRNLVDVIIKYKKRYHKIREYFSKNFIFEMKLRYRIRKFKLY